MMPRPKGKLKNKKPRNATSAAVAAPQGAEYVERADADKREAMRVSIDRGLKRFDAGLERVNAAGKELVAGVNEIRAAGKDFYDAQDLNQLEFRNWSHGTDDWQEEQKRREKMKCAIRVYELLKAAPAKGLQDCPRALQLVFEHAQLVVRTKRIGQQGHEPQNPWTAFTSRVSDLETLVLGLRGERQWHDLAPDELEKFVRTAKPFVKEVMDAEKALAEK